MRAGIKKFQEKGKAKGSKELTQMHGMNLFCPVARESLTKEERARDFKLLMFLKKKQD
jgi:hypothetical protein